MDPRQGRRDPPSRRGRLAAIETFEDGSWLDELPANNDRLNSEHVVVRVVDDTIGDGRDAPIGPVPVVHHHGRA